MATADLGEDSRDVGVQALAAALGVGLLVSPAIGADDPTAPDILPGVDLVTEEVEPGVYRVLSDGAAHDLQDGIRAMATIDGSAWVETSRVFELGRPDTYPSTRSGLRR